MKKLDLITTATIRPEILDITYSSFKKNLFKAWPFRVIINIDPIGDTGHHTAEDVEAVARKHFDEVIVHKPEKADFSKALIWLWQHVETEFFFNLEDDWKLREEVDSFPRMVAAMEKHPRLALLRMQLKSSNEKEAQFRARGWPPGTWNGDYFDVPRLHYTGAPSLIRKSFIHVMLKYMTPLDNHEHIGKRLLRMKKDPEATKWIYGGYGKLNVKGPLIANIGVTWRRKFGFSKKGRPKKNGTFYWIPWKHR